MDLSDTITVMRAGETIARLQTSTTSPAEIARAMVGREVSLMSRQGEALGVASHPEAPTTAEAHATAGYSAALEVKDLVVIGPRETRAIDGITFAVQPGEIFGIAGVEGNGQSELIEAVAGLRRVSSGTVHLGQRDITNRDVRERGDAGLSHIPEDRHRRGLVLEYSLADNLILGRQHRFTRSGVLDRRGIATHGDEQVKAFDIRPPDATLPAGALSGGNQQKVVIAREMGREFSVLLASQPTRGVDVGAIEFIHGRIRAAAASGQGVLLVSADLVEVLALADRVAVMYDGQFVVVLPRAEASAEVLGPYMTGLAGRVA